MPGTKSQRCSMLVKRNEPKRRYLVGRGISGSNPRERWAMGTIPNPSDVYETEIRPRMEAARQLMDREAELGAEQVAQFAVHLLIGVLEFCGEEAA